MPNPQTMLMMAIAFLTALTVHEYAHARAALAEGDDTAKVAGRISLNPLDHLDPFGAIMFALMMMNGFGIAWGKPVPVNPYRFRSPRWGNLRVSLWGPLSNILFACALALLFRFIVAGRFGLNYVPLILTCISMNLVLAMFNLLPVPPLDGSKVLASLLPYETARRYEEAMGKYGFLILIGLLLTGVISIILGPPRRFLFGLLTGIPF
ncbi:MAG: site-2 protease family protein [Armatimonadetes bacterium]|nr:site-2 protease family protein [Armatimonadota bacterium]